VTEQHGQVDRKAMLRRLRAEIHGPSTGPWDDRATRISNRIIPPELEGWMLSGPMIESDSGQELLLSARAPKSMYGVGVLFPRERGSSGNPVVGGDASGSDEESLGTPESEDAADPAVESGQGAQFALKDDAPTGAPRSAEESAAAVSPPPRQRLRQSSIGLSFVAACPAGTEVVIELPSSWRMPWQAADESVLVNGWYETVALHQPQGTGQARHLRHSLLDSNQPLEVVFGVAELAGENGELTRTVVARHLTFEVRLRYRRRRGTDEFLLTAFLINTSVHEPADRANLYQALFAARPRGPGACLLPYAAEATDLAGRDADDLSLELLYSEILQWGIGHGCAAGWDYGLAHPSVVWADCMPVVELPSMTPDVSDAEGNPLTVSMMAFCDRSRPWSDRAQPLRRVVDGYEAWLKSRYESLGKLQVGDLLRERAKEHLEGCSAALARMRAGLEILDSDPLAQEAFRLANCAMALQQCAQRDVLPGAFDGGGRSQPCDLGDALVAKRWRAFQIGFMLSSIRGIVQPEHADRGEVDLIWFPTGGGKTEAYLGLVAFVGFHRRMVHGVEGEGTACLMRYTLRMLTTQQFQRGASLMLAMEWLRTNIADGLGRRGWLGSCAIQGHSLGDAPFSLGLWVGSGASPNTDQDAIAELRRWKSGNSKDAESPFPLIECPWCRTTIERRGAGRSAVIHGYRASDGVLEAYCPSHDCAFQEVIPVRFVDERIYDEPPTLLIGTVDKFVQLTFRDDARAIFGFPSSAGPGARTRRPPSVIIQDELHLITGPLGSLYGTYESVVEELCTDDEGVRPKIICSTATTRGAHSQVRALFARDRLAVFPSPGLSIKDSFFGCWSYEADGTLSPGRMYVGIFAPNYQSQQISNTRVFSTALLAAKADVPANRRDPWWTLLAYFRSIRELAGAATLCQFDIEEYMKKAGPRWGLGSKPGAPGGSGLRYIRRVDELSGRLEASEVLDRLSRLGRPHDPERPDTGPPDICLATNIIEVGVDVPRLSLLLMDGPPGSAARYIQVSGRVGRDWRRAPGMVLTVYNKAKPRDISHFEHFLGDHLRLYAAVEPNSVTPFSEEAIERHVHSAAVAWVRAVFGSRNPRYSKDVENELMRFEQALMKRIDRAVPDSSASHRAKEDASAQLHRLRKRWRANPDMSKWVVWQASDDLALLLPAGKYFSIAQRDAGFETMTSLRNVDSTARISIRPNFQEPME
jgi:hypothetical protein